MRTIAIIGGGYSGISLVLNLARLAKQPLKIILFEKNPQVALGAAYSTKNPSHLLNVRANNMSAFPDLPNHFIDWLAQDAVAQQYLDPHQAIAQQFVPRCIYGRYLQFLWQVMLQDKNKAIHLTVKNQEVLTLKQITEQEWQVTTAQETYSVNDVVLATGNMAPRHLFTDIDDDHLLNNPWQEGALNHIAPKDDVLIVGTGLTMVDIVLSLKSQNHCGKIYALARRACLPQAHNIYNANNIWADIETWPKKLSELMRLIRKRAQTAADWREAVDALRPYTQLLWQSLSKEDQRRFVRHVAPYWDTHRHRIAEQVADVIMEARSSGQLTVLAGRLQSLKKTHDHLEVIYKPRGLAQTKTLAVKWLINCTGPNSNFHFSDHPLFKSLLDQNLIVADPHGLGLLTDHHGRLLKTNEQAHDNFFTLAAVCKPLLWECIAVPDVRQQSFALAQYLIDAACHYEL